MGYTYETFPGQTIVRKRDDGFSARELIEEIDRNGEGQVVLADDSNADDFLRAMEGLACGNLHQGNWEPYFRQSDRN